MLNAAELPARSLTTSSAVGASRSRLAPRRRRDRLAALPAPVAPPVAFSIPEGRKGGRGGRPFCRATSAGRACFSTARAAIVACCASARSCRAALSARRRATTDTSVPTRSRNTASEKASSDAAPGDDMHRLNHVTALSPTGTPGNLPRLRLTGSKLVPCWRGRQRVGGRRHRSG